MVTTIFPTPQALPPVTLPLPIKSEESNPSLLNLGWAGLASHSLETNMMSQGPWGGTTRCHTKLASPALALGAGFQARAPPTRAAQPALAALVGGAGPRDGARLWPRPACRSGLGPCGPRPPRCSPCGLLLGRQRPALAYHGRAAGVAEPRGSGGRPGSVPRHLAPGRCRPCVPPPVFLPLLGPPDAQLLAAPPAGTTRAAR